MRKCACGARVKEGDINAVFVYDLKGNLLRVACGHCAAFRNPKHKTGSRKKPWGQFFSPNGIRFQDYDDDVI